MANELAVSKNVVREIVSMAKLLGPNQQAAVIIALTVSAASAFAFCYRETIKRDYEFRFDRNGISLSRSDGASDFVVAS